MRKFAAIVLIAMTFCSMFRMGVNADTGSFKDVKDSDWYAGYVAKLCSLKIIEGYNGKFNPAGNVTRAEFTKMLVQAAGCKKVDGVSFKDIKPFPASKPHWAAVYVETALRNGILVKEEIGDNFYPDVPLDRLDMAVMACRALKLQPSAGENPFADMIQPNGYVTKVYEEYIVRGSIEGGKRVYKPAGLTSRAEAAAILSRLVEYKKDPAGYKANAKAEEQKTGTTVNGVPLRLYAYMEGTKGRGMKAANEFYYHWIKGNEGEALDYAYPEVKSFESPEAFVKYQVDIVKRYMRYNFNVDYRTVGQAYIDGLGDTLGVNTVYEANKNITEFKKYKVVCTSEFLTDYDLIFKKDGLTETVRGTLRIKFDKPTSPEYVKKFGIEVGKWYDMDMDIMFGRNSVTGNWKIARNNYYEFFTRPILISK